jgi:hypothetical protein
VGNNRGTWLPLSLAIIKLLRRINCAI